jgi:hypothetical protein
LELQRFLIKERPALGEAGTIYDIFDPGTQKTMGVVREKSGAVRKFLCKFLSKRFLTIELEVRETEDESLVFTVRGTTGLWRRRIEVYDADDHMMGYAESRAFSGRNGFWMYDRRSLPFAEIKAVLQGPDYRFQAADGRELGTVTRERRAPVTQAPLNQYLVSTSDELAEQPLAKMLVLGAALAMNIVHQGQGNKEKK